jgi:two-component system response regulator AlgR
MRVLIVDDEKLARDRLRELLTDIGGYTVIGEAMSGAEAVEKAAELNPDVLLMDIRMPGMDGLEAAMHLMGMEHPPSVIFTTAYDQHALDAFDVNAVDYLLKPIRKDRLANALTKARKLTVRQIQELNQTRKEMPTRTHISVHLRGNIRLVPVPDIIYFLADSKYVVIRTATEEHLIEDSLVNLEKEFGERFLRVHRNALVATQFIKGIEKNPAGTWQVNLRGVEKKLDVSRRHTASVRRWARNRPISAMASESKSVGI